MNANLLRLSRVGFHPSVVSKSTTSPPGSPVSGEGYIVPSGAAGAWSGQSGKIAIWDGAAWVYITPRDGFLVHVADADGLALYDGGAWSADVLRADRLAAAYAHSQATGNPHGTTAAQVGAMETANPVFTGALKQGGTTRITSGGGTDFASLRVSNLSSAFNGVLTSDYVGVVGVRGATDFRDNYIQAAASDHNHDSEYAPLSGAEILIHSDFGRSATTDAWQSAFTDNTAAGLQLAANSIASGTEITIEQVLNMPGDGGYSVYQVYIGPQLTGDQGPVTPLYVDVLDPEVDYGEGKLCIKIELIGSGSSITGYVTSTWTASNSTKPTVRYGTLTVDGTIANSIDVRFNPQSVTSYVIRRNRVRRCNP